MNPPPISPVEEIAGRLSEAQRRELLNAVPQGRIIATGEPAYFKVWSRFRSTMSILHARGLADGGILTPLGRTVRDHLRATLNPEGTDHG